MLTPELVADIADQATETFKKFGVSSIIFTALTFSDENGMAKLATSTEVTVQEHTIPSFIEELEATIAKLKEQIKEKE